MKLRWRCGSLLSCLRPFVTPMRQTSPLWCHSLCLQNAAARLITRTKTHAHFNPILKSLHWLPIKYRIRFKVLLIVVKSFHNSAPSYISDMLPTYTPRRLLRFTGTNLIIKQRKKSKKSYGHDFSYFAQKHWNKLPLNTRLSETEDSFKNALKTQHAPNSSDNIAHNSSPIYPFQTSPVVGSRTITLHFAQYGTAIHPFIPWHTDHWYSHPIVLIVWSGSCGPFSGLHISLYCPYPQIAFVWSMSPLYTPRTALSYVCFALPFGQFLLTLFTLFVCLTSFIVFIALLHFIDFIGCAALWPWRKVLYK